MSFSLLGSLEAQHVTRQIPELRFRQRHLWHDGTGRDGLRISKMFQMPFSFRPRIADERQVRPDHSSFTVNAMTADAAELIKERAPARESRIHARYGIEVFERDAQQGKDHKEKQ